MTRTPTAVLAVIATAGICLLATENTRLVPDSLTDSATLLPTLGIALLFGATILYLAAVRFRLKLPPLPVLIPVTLMLASMAASNTVSKGLLPGLMVVALGVLMVAVYSLTREHSTAMRLVIMWFTLLCAAGVVVYTAVHPGVRTGGYIVSVTNYNLIVGALVLGTLLSPDCHRWWVAAITLPALFLTGSSEGLFVGTAVTGWLLLTRWRHISRKYLLPVAALGIMVVVCTPLGITGKLYRPSMVKIAAMVDVLTDSPPAETAAPTTPAPSAGTTTDSFGTTLAIATGYRAGGNWSNATFGLMGSGYVLMGNTAETPHNVLLVATTQGGALAAVGWLWVTLWCLLKGKRKYLAIALLALGVFDNFIWAQMSPWWWISMAIMVPTTQDKQLTTGH